MWVYKGKSVNGHDDLHPDCTDIVYLIKYTSGEQYIGKKAVRAMRKYPPLKGKVRCRRKLKDLPFANYKGSHGRSDDLEVLRKEILYQCSKRKAATYMETSLLFEHRAIFSPSYLNENIGGTFFRNSLEGIIHVG